MFTWIPIYTELAEKLLEYRNRQDELLALLKRIKDQGLPMINLVDQGPKGKKQSLTEIDPFTFFASFNRKAKHENRRAILTMIKEELGLQAEVPEDFDGIPIMNPMMSWFMPWESERDPGDVPALWDYAAQIVRRTPDQVNPDLFKRCLLVHCVSITNLTMGMFWMRPDTYLALDSRNKKRLDELGIEPDVADWPTYLGFLERLPIAVRNKPYEFSRSAYVGGDEAKTWIFQCNPDRYDLVGALRAKRVESWSVRQHKEAISPGDKVIIWATGKLAGCYALATVTSKLQASESSQDDEEYWTDKKGPDTSDWVSIEIEHNLVEAPVKREQLTGDAALKDLPVGRQGTNILAQRSHYDALVNLLKEMTMKRFWIYAPGPNATFWDDCLRDGIMVYGANELPDLLTFKSREDLLKVMQRTYKERNPKNRVLAAWEFSRVVKPGDVIIVKRGKRTFIGYGVVTGSYRYDNSRDSYRNVIPVEWAKQGEWIKDKGGPIVQKTLTDITKYPDYVEDLKSLIGIGGGSGGGPKQSHFAFNTILYGPPGTGKTWALRNQYMPRFVEEAAAVSRQDFAAKLVETMSWWEVITMVMLDLKSSKVRDIQSHPLMQARISRANNRNPKAAIWAHLQMHTKKECPLVNYTKRYEPLYFWKDEHSVWSIDEALAHEAVPELLEKLEKYRNFKPGQGEKIERYAFTTFHQSYSYEDFVEGIKPVMVEDGAMDEVPESLAYEIKPGIFKTMVNRALADPSHDYALIIDEINRGNVANIFGELITLIEEDKRMGKKEALSAVLPYSRDSFVVPHNLYIIGAMNTADRSVEALDTALRRRFTFIAVPPRPDLIEQPDSLVVDLKLLLQTINARIEKLLDKDHAIGHSYFMGIAESTEPFAELQRVFGTKVLPLLEEYFYGDPAKIGMVLGERFVTRNDGAVEWAKGDWGIDDFEERRLYTLQDPLVLSEEDFRSIYE
jgi:hypothetical protein